MACGREPKLVRAVAAEGLDVAGLATDRVDGLSADVDVGLALVLAGEAVVDEPVVRTPGDVAPMEAVSGGEFRPPRGSERVPVR